MTDALLSLENVHSAYGKSNILNGVDLHVDAGEVVSILGRNGVGKTTTLRSIVGRVVPHEGRVDFDGTDLVSMSQHDIVQRGISYVPEDREVFPDLTVRENLRMGTFRGDGGLYTLEEVFDAFPRLDERSDQRGSTLSGGEQQMLVIARALLGPTKLLMLDEPTEGLAPQIVSDVIDIVQRLKEEEVTILFVEQNVSAAMEIADRHYILEGGEMVYEGTNTELKDSPDVQDRHLGVNVDTSAW